MATAQEWWMGPESLWGRGQSALNNLGQGIQRGVNDAVNWWTGPNSLWGKGNAIGQGWLNRTVQDAQGQGVPESVLDTPEFRAEITQAIQDAHLPQDQMERMYAGLQTGRWPSVYDALTEIDSLRRANEFKEFSTGALGRLGEYQTSATNRFEGDRQRELDAIAQQEQEYLGPGSNVDETINRLTAVRGDPMALSRDIDYRGIFANVLNQTTANANKATREAGQRAAGRGVSGAGGAAVTTLGNVQNQGAQMRADAFNNATTDALRRLSNLTEGRNTARTEFGTRREGVNRFYDPILSDIGRWGETYGNELRSGSIRDPFDFSQQAENRYGATTYNQGLSRESLDRALGLLTSGLGLGVNALGQATNIQIPRLGK